MEYAKDIEGLKRQLEETDNLPDRVEILARITREVAYNNPSAAFQYANQSLEDALNSNDAISIAKSYTNMGAICSKIVGLDEGLEYHKLSLKYALESKDDDMLATCYGNLAITYFQTTDNQEEGVSLIHKALSIHKRASNDRGLVFVYTTLSAYYANSLEDFERGLHYGELALELARKTGIQRVILDALQVVGQCKLLNAPSEVLPLMEEAVKICKSKVYESERSIAHSTMGTAYVLLGNNQMAEWHFDKMEKVLSEQAVSTMQATLYINIAMGYGKTGNFLKAKDYLHKSLTISDKNGDRSHIRKTYAFLSVCYHEMGDYGKASKYSGASIELYEKILNEKIVNKTLHLETKYKLKQKQSEIELLEKEKTIQQQKIASLEQERQIERMRGYMEAEQNERRRMALEIHDNLGSQLAGLKMQLSGMARQSGTNANKWEGVLQLADQICRETRHLAHNLLPRALAGQNLGDALQDYVSEIAHHCPFELKYYQCYTGEPGELEKKQLFGVVQEALHNCVKHSGAQEVFIQLVQHGNRLKLIIEDDGAGFDKSGIAKNKRGIGIGNMQKRCELMNANFSLESTPRQGTGIIVTLPGKPGNNVREK